MSKHPRTDAAESAKTVDQPQTTANLVPNYRVMSYNNIMQPHVKGCIQLKEHLYAIKQIIQFYAIHNHVYIA